MRNRSKNVGGSTSKHDSKEDEKSTGRWSLRSSQETDTCGINGKESLRSVRLKRKAQSEDSPNVTPKKKKGTAGKGRECNRNTSKTGRRDATEAMSSDSNYSSESEEVSPRRESLRHSSNTRDSRTRSSSQKQTRSTPSRGDKESSADSPRKHRRERSESPDEPKVNTKKSTEKSGKAKHSESTTGSTRSSRSQGLKDNTTCNTEVKQNTVVNSKRPRRNSSAEESVSRNSRSGSEESTILNGDINDGVTHDTTDDTTTDELDDSDSDVHSISSDEVPIELPVKLKSTTGVHGRVNELERSLLEAKTVFAQAKTIYEKKLRAKDEELERLKNELQWKDEQLNDMNDLASKNMELESRMNHVLGDKEAYDAEVKRVKEEEENEEKENQEKKKKDEEKKKKDDEMKKNGEKVNEESVDTKGNKKKRRSRRGKKKEEESEGEDIDALFVSDEDEVAIVGEEECKPIEITESDKEESPVKSKKPIKEVAKKPEKVKSDTGSQKQEVESEADQDDEDGEDKKDKHGRHTIRKVMKGKKLQEETVKAAKTEKERRERAQQEHDKHEVVTGTDAKTKLPICTKLVLAFKERKEKDKNKAKVPLVEVNSRLIKKLKSHQWQGVEFMWDNVVESMDKLKGDDPGQGCILAHCMGLGKTLSVITLVHTLLSSEHTEQFTSCLVVCPLNTIFNWQYEWKKWLDKRDRLPIFEMASCKHNVERAKLLQTWRQSGGVMIMGYQLFRILANYPGKSKKNKKAFEECLLDPGPDIVICDEGHILKNDGSAISKAMNSIRSKRRVILTGTPLQNNLTEYHCMVNFVKPNLLGTLKEFKNRFVNPITNGQHRDSTSMDVRVMKRRAHILHEMLAGCVQRKDYTELTKLLPPKYEYVISVRLSTMQMDLYEKYLELNRTDGNRMGVGTSLFSDYQALMRIWTHPWVLKMEEERQGKKAFQFQDDELDELDESEEDEDIVISSDTEEDSQTSQDDDEGVVDDDSGNDDSGEDAHGDYRPSKKKSKQIDKLGKRLPRNMWNMKGKLKAAEESAETGEESESSTRRTRKTRSKESLKPVNGSKKDKKQVSDKRDRLGDNTDDGDSSATEDQPDGSRKAKVLAGEVIRKWKSSFRHGGNELINLEDLRKKEDAWWTKYFNEEEHKKKADLSGKLVLLFEIVRMAESVGDKVLVFSQSLLSLDLIELFLSYKDEEAESAAKKKNSKVNHWKKDEDYLRMDGSTGAQSRTKFTSNFNDPKNKRLRLFLISTRAGGLGINLDSANRVIIFDASWNPSHDVQSIFRVYRFGQDKPVYVYRFVAQGTMEDKIYERQVTKETLAQRVIDEHQIASHFTFSDLQELYLFKPDRLNDPDAPKRPTPAVPKDVVLAELLTTHKDWIVKYHEHDSLLENRPEENLTEEEREKAWDEYEKDKQGLYSYHKYMPSYHFSQQAPSVIGPIPHRPFITSTTTSSLPVYNNPLMLPRLPPAPIYPSSGSTATDATKSVQMAQLPRVVQEILKYNPNISTDELQKRLQAFLGMQNRYQGVGQMVRPVIDQQTIGTDSESESGSSMPSRLPQPGHVPADRKG